MSPSRVQQRPWRPQSVSIIGRPHDGRVQIIPIDQPPKGTTNPGARPRLSLVVPTIRGKTPRHLANLDLSGRKVAYKDSGLSSFRIGQLSYHYFTHSTRDSADMADLPAARREQLCVELLPELITPVRTLRADGGRAIRHLWELHDGVYVESILMRYKERTTLCVSSQAGCGMVCPFCAAGQMGLTRDLSTGEIVKRVRHTVQASAVGELTGGSARLSNMVFMGMDEPMVGCKSAVGVLHRLIGLAPKSLGLSARGIIVSTAGPIPLIHRPVGKGLSVTLAIPLRVSDDGLHDELIPANSKWKVGELFDAVHDHFLVIGRHTSIRYAFIENMNDHVWCAQLPIDELNHRSTGWTHVNPIPLNPTPGSIWTCLGAAVQNMFIDTPRCAGITTAARNT